MQAGSEEGEDGSYSTARQLRVETGSDRAGETQGDWDSERRDAGHREQKGDTAHCENETTARSPTRPCSEISPAFPQALASPLVLNSFWREEGTGSDPAGVCAWFGSDPSPRHRCRVLQSAEPPPSGPSPKASGSAAETSYTEGSPAQNSPPCRARSPFIPTAPTLREILIFLVQP